MQYFTIDSCSKFLALFILLTFAPSGFAINKTLPQVKSSKDYKKIKYKPPYGLGLPKGTVGTGVRGNCSQVSFCLTPLMPEKVDKSNQPTYYPLTISERPTFFINIPRVSGTGYFTLYQQVASSPKKIYETTFPVNISGGIIRFKLPLSAPALKVNTTYEWKLKIGENLINEEEVIGVLRVARLSTKVIEELAKSAPLERAFIYAREGIWFESIQTLAGLKETEPTNQNILTAWSDLLGSANLKNVAKQPLVQCCVAEN
jgi:hypothetical protein